MRIWDRLIGLVVCGILCVVVVNQEVFATEYVWARSAWGSSNINGHYSSMSNGYGGYYVPRNAYGNNFEAQGNFTNANGYIVPAQQGQVQQSAQTPIFHGHRRRRARH